jgi:hypothetical protein
MGDVRGILAWASFGGICPHAAAALAYRFVLRSGRAAHDARVIATPAARHAIARMNRVAAATDTAFVPAHRAIDLAAHRARLAR